MVNAHEFLCNAKYRKAQGRKPSPNAFTRKYNNQLQEYEITDSPKKLKTLQEWERVVGVALWARLWLFR